MDNKAVDKGQTMAPVAPKSMRWRRAAIILMGLTGAGVTGFALVTPAYAETGIAKAVATIQSFGFDEPGDLGMIAIGVVGLILGRQSGLFMRKRDQNGAR